LQSKLEPTSLEAKEKLAAAAEVPAVPRKVMKVFGGEVSTGLVGPTTGGAPGSEGIGDGWAGDCGASGTGLTGGNTTRALPWRPKTTPRRSSMAGRIRTFALHCAEAGTPASVTPQRAAARKWPPPDWAREKPLPTTNAVIDIVNPTAPRDIPRTVTHRMVSPSRSSDRLIGPTSTDRESEIKGWTHVRYPSS